MDIAKIKPLQAFHCSDGTLLPCLADRSAILPNPRPSKVGRLQRGETMPRGGILKKFREGFAMYQQLSSKAVPTSRHVVMQGKKTWPERFFWGLLP